jgi:dynein heavy chain
MFPSADYMHYFLLYGRQLTQKELDKLEDNENAIPKEVPGLEQFGAQIDHYEGLHEEVRAFGNTLNLQGWFRADVTPFKHALMNCIKRWSYSFKKHLLDHLIKSLNELNEFIEKADESLMTQVHEGDYEVLIKVMEYLALVCARQRRTDNMFEPLQDLIDLLRQYGMVIPNESLAQLEELPEKWANTKRLGIMAKTQVAPLMGMEIGKLKDRIEEYEKFQRIFRNKYQGKRFYIYECKTPYEGLRKAQEQIDEFEEKLNNLQSEAKLFEVTVPDFPLAKQCRRENKMLKDLWDYIYLVRSSIELWKTTSWGNIDVEGMDMECKKFGKDIRGLDKDMRTWHAFIGLESAVKNMLTSLRAIGELQNPAIRDRHWQQLVQVVKVRFIMSDSTTLADLLDLSLHNYEDEVSKCSLTNLPTILYRYIILWTRHARSLLWKR